MAKFRYIGDQPHGNCLGLQFPRNIYIEVENPIHQKKLAGNPAFQQASPGRPAASAGKNADQSATGEGKGSGNEGSGKEPSAD